MVVKGKGEEQEGVGRKMVTKERRIKGGQEGEVEEGWRRKKGVKCEVEEGRKGGVGNGMREGDERKGGRKSR